MPLIAFNNEQKLIENEIRKFAKNELEPLSDEIDKKGIFPVEIIKKLSDLGLSSLTIPEKYGGAGLDTTSLCIVLEELSKVCASISTILAVNNCLVAFPIIKFAPEEKKDYYLKKLGQGEIGAFGPDVGIDVSDKNIEIREKDGNYVISGKKDFVLNGETADFFLLPLSLSNGKALYALENTRGVHVTKHHMLGLRAAGFVTWEFKNIKLMSNTCILNSEEAFQQIHDYSNIGFSAISLGIAEAAYDASIKYSKERTQFGRAICEFPMVQEMLIDMKTRIETARLLVYNAAAQCDKGYNYALDSRIARLQSGEAAVFAGIKAIQVHGGYGYIKEYPVERYLRDAKAIQVLNETPQDVKSKIAKELLI